MTAGSGVVGNGGLLTPAAADVRREAARLGLEMLDELSAFAWQEIQTKLPDFAARAREQGKTIVRRDVASSVRTVLLCVAERREPRPDEAKRLRRLGTRHAGHVIPADDAIDSIDIATAAGFRALASMVSDGSDQAVSGAVLSEMAADAIAAIRAVRREVAGGYAEHGRLPLLAVEGSAHDERSVLAAFVDDVLAGVVAEAKDGDDAVADAIAATARALGLENFEPPMAVAVVVPSKGHSATAVGPAVARLSDRIGGALRGSVQRTPTGHATLLVPFTEPGNELARILGRAARSLPVVVFVQPVAHLASLGPTYQAMRRELALVRVAVRRPGLLWRDELDVLRVLSDQAEPDDVFAFVRDEIGPLLACARSEDYLSTLQALHDNDGNADLAAQRLGISTAGLRSRIQRIRETSEVRLNEPTTRFKATLAVLLFRLHESDMPPVGDAAWS